MAVALLDAAPRPTAVYTLDHRRAEFRVDSPRDIPKDLRAWAAACRIEPRDPLFRLDCPELREGDGGEAMPATLALVRDLDETVYLVGCPLLDGERLRRLERAWSRPEDERTPNPQLEADLRDCKDLEAGRTFSAEVEGDGMGIVIRGRQLRLHVFRVREMERTSSTPYDPSPSRGSLGHAGPSTTSAPAPLNPVLEPNWAPPSEPRSLTRPRSAEASLRDPGLARTSLRAGRVRVSCRGADAEIWIDGAYMGAAPIATPLPAGRHSVIAVRDGREWTAELELEAGASESIDPCKGR